VAFSTKSDSADVNSITEKRDLLLSARTRFAPETQSLRQAAVQKTVEQVLLRLENHQRLALPAIHEKLNRTLGNETSVIGLPDVREALKVLVKENRVAGHGTGLDGRVYWLNPEARATLLEAQKVSEARLRSLVTRLFMHAPGHPDKYYTAFFECIRLIFGQIADGYVRQITGKALPDELATHQVVTDSLDEVVASFPSVNSVALRRGVQAFLTDVDPESSEVKWNLTQNSYLLRALGLDEKGFLLSKEVLGGATVYLDTNVLIHMLEPRARLHKNCVALANACARLDVSLRTAHISVSELNGVVAHHRDVMIKVADEIPAETATKVNDVFFQAFLTARHENPDLSVKEFFESFDSPSEKLESFGCEVADDAWFLREKKSMSTRELARVIKSEYERRHPGQPKREAAAVHDALMVAWIERERLEGNDKCWLVTLDTSLPAFIPKGAKPVPLAITLDALLQWISPLAAREGLDEDLSEMFSMAIRQQVLPHETFFELPDFLILAELEWSCKDLPAEDVEECVRSLGSFTHMDLTKPENREKLSHAIAKFFADPSRKYKGAVQKLEEQLAEKDKEKAELVAEHERQVAEILQASQIQLDKINAKVDALEAQNEEARERIQREQDSRAQELQERKTRKSAFRRLVAAAIVFLVVESLGVLIALNYGSGDNWLQKLVAFSVVLLVAAAVSSVLGSMIVGRTRMHHLPHVFQRLMRWPLGTRD